MRNIRKVLLISVILFGMSFHPVLGRPNQGDFSLGQSFGGYLFSGNQELRNGMLWNSTIGYHLTDTIGTEFSCGFVDSIQTTDPRDDQDGFLLRLNMIRYFEPIDNLNPFISAGGGTFAIHYDRKDITPIVNYGGGIEYYFTKNVAFRADLTHIFCFYRQNNNFSFSFGIKVNFNQNQLRKTFNPDKEDQINAPIGGIAPEGPLGILPGEDGKFTHNDMTGERNAGMIELPTGIVPAERQGEAELGTESKDVAPDLPGGIDVASLKSAQGNTDGKSVAETELQKWVVHFDKNKAKITLDHFEQLKDFAIAAKAEPNAMIYIEGHSDHTGSKDHNYQLSEKRAKALQKFMMKRFNLEPSRFVLSWSGWEKPIAENKTETGRRMNRRAEIILKPTVEAQP